MAEADNQPSAVSQECLAMSAASAAGVTIINGAAVIEQAGGSDVMLGKRKSEEEEHISLPSGAVLEESESTVLVCLKRARQTDVNGDDVIPRASQVESLEEYEKEVEDAPGEPEEADEYVGDYLPPEGVEHEQCRVVILGLKEQVVGLGEEMARLNRKLSAVLGGIPMCPVCMEDALQPVELADCRHLLCCQCLYSIVERNRNEGGDVWSTACPLCRTVVSSPPKAPPISFMQHLEKMRETFGLLPAPLASIQPVEPGSAENEEGDAEAEAAAAAAALATKTREEEMNQYREQLQELKKIFARRGADEPFYDESDHVYRCVKCNWEMANGRCTNCGWRWDGEELEEDGEECEEGEDEREGLEAYDENNLDEYEDDDQEGEDYDDEEGEEEAQAAGAGVVGLEGEEEEEEDFDGEYSEQEGVQNLGVDEYGGGQRVQLGEGYNAEEGAYVVDDDGARSPVPSPLHGGAGVDDLADYEDDEERGQETEQEAAEGVGLLDDEGGVEGEGDEAGEYADEGEYGEAGADEYVGEEAVNEELYEEYDEADYADEEDEGDVNADRY